MLFYFIVSSVKYSSIRDRLFVRRKVKSEFALFSVHGGISEIL